jgi:hypothetical protein
MASRRAGRAGTRVLRFLSKLVRAGSDGSGGATRGSRGGARPGSASAVQASPPMAAFPSTGARTGPVDGWGWGERGEAGRPSRDIGAKGPLTVIGDAVQ